MGLGLKLTDELARFSFLGSLWIDGGFIWARPMDMPRDSGRRAGRKGEVEIGWKSFGYVLV